jgi:hypothetical protein
VEDWLNFCANLREGFATFHGVKDYVHEGIVVRPAVECYSYNLRGRLSFKVVNNDYLLKEK